MPTRHTTLLRLLLAVLICGQVWLGGQDIAAKALPLALDQVAALADDGPDGDPFGSRPAAKAVVSPNLIPMRSAPLAVRLPETPVATAHHWATGPPRR
jgi:hypothetical protein